MTDVLVIQNTKIEGSGQLGALLEEDGFDIHTVHAKTKPLPQKDFNFAVILGGPQSATDNLLFMRKEEDLIRKYVENQKPVLGICLGSQLIAQAFGAKVYPGPIKEIGFYHDLKIEDNSSALFSGFENPFTVFHWHSDTFDLPHGSKRLVSSDNYLNQAFQIGSAVGLQFHLEVTYNMVRLWLDKTEEKLSSIPYLNLKKIRSDVDSNISVVNGNLEKFYNNFKLEFNL